MSNLHDPIEPFAEENTDIVEIDGQEINVPVTVVFGPFPSPGIVIKVDQLPGFLLGKERFEIALGNGARLEAMVRSLNPGTGRGSLVPARQPVNVIDKGVPLRLVKFSILNYPKFYSNQMKWYSDEQCQIAVPHTELEAADWRVEFTGLINRPEVDETIRREKRYGVTYNGVITRSDGADFTVKEVETLLEALRTFLSFARGASCSLASVEGTDRFGKRAWVRWGAHYVASGNKRQLLIRQVDGEDDFHSELIPRFWFLFERGDEWKTTILRSINWYLQSNESPPYIGLILTLAGLERLAYQLLGRAKEKDRTGEFIEKALRKLNIESELPDSCKHLRKVGVWEIGPHALTAVRNDLIHPEERLGNLSHDVYREAWNLGQWYVEMILLKKLRFEGEYVNRLQGWRDRGQAIQCVPWAQEE